MATDLAVDYHKSILQYIVGIMLLVITIMVYYSVGIIPSILSVTGTR